VDSKEVLGERFSAGDDEISGDLYSRSDIGPLTAWIRSSHTDFSTSGVLNNQE